jgi:histidinol dehydrogenase
MIQILKGKSSARLKRILNRGNIEYPREERAVRAIIRQVKLSGNRALFALTRKFDKVTLASGNIRVSSAHLTKQANRCSRPLQFAIKSAIQNIRRFHKKQKLQGYVTRPQKGIRLGLQVMPIESVGLYIPGGKSPLFSTILMTAIPAQIAGVKRIVVVTPPTRQGLHPAMAYALKQLKLTQVYQIGGAQAVAALAFGTSAIPRVDKIVGPGNIYVSLAKKILYGKVDIDMVAGPSEILVIADKYTPPAFIARDLLSQAEHGTGDESVILLTNNSKLAQAVHKEIRSLVAASPLRRRVEKSLERYGAIIVLKSIAECVELANRIAPEHLELLVKHPRTLVKKIKNAGAVFLGPYACESIGDYFAGPNHVLPTNGTARFYSPLGVYHFTKRMSVVEYSKKALQKSGSKIVTMALEEDLPFHAASVTIRLSQK